MQTETSTNTQLPVVAFAKGNYKNRFGGTTSFNRPGQMQVFKAQHLVDQGWVFTGYVIDDEWQTELRFNAQPGGQFVAVINHADVRSTPVDELVGLISGQASSLMTEDGYTFHTRTPSGMWTDSDLALGPDVREFANVGATLTIVHTTTVVAYRKTLAAMGFSDCTLPTGLPGLRVCMPGGCGVLIAHSLLGLDADLQGQGVQLVGLDGGGQTLFSKTCQAGDFIDSVREACKGMYAYGRGLIQTQDLVAEIKAVFDRHLHLRLGFAAERVAAFAAQSLHDELVDYVQAIVAAGQLALEETPDPGAALEVATMKDLGWQEADGYTKDQIEGARYMRVFGGNGSPFARHEMTIAKTQAGWIPIHGSVKLPPVANPFEAAQVLTQYWAELPISMKVTHQYAQSVRIP